MTKISLLRHLLPVSALFFGTPFFPHLAHGAQSVEGAVAAAKGTAIKAMLKELDDQLDRLDELEDNAPTREEKVAAQARIKALKQRRTELRKNYAQVRYDSLKADVKGEFDKLSAWTKKTFSSNPGAKTMAAANRENLAATADIGTYRATPTDENKLDAKASLSLLDAHIDTLRERGEKLPAGPERDSTNLRVKALKARRDELAADFRQARFDALMDDVKTEWRKITN